MRYAGVRASLLVASLMVGAISVAIADTPDTGSTTIAPATTTLQGGVVAVKDSLNDLRDARLSISRVRKATANLYDEVTRQQVTMTYNPNLVGTTVITVPVPVFTGQFLAPRKKWVNASMSEIGPIITLFKEDVDLAIENNRHADVSEKTRQALEPLRNEAFADVKSSFDIYKQLEGLTSGGAYDNNAIASASKDLDSHMKQLDRTLKKGISLLQKEAKSSKKTKEVSLTGTNTL